MESGDCVVSRPIFTKPPYTVVGRSVGKLDKCIYLERNVSPHQHQFVVETGPVGPSVMARPSSARSLYLEQVRGAEGDRPTCGWRCSHDYVGTIFRYLFSCYVGKEMFAKSCFAIWQWQVRTCLSVRRTCWGSLSNEGVERFFRSLQLLCYVIRITLRGR